ncbi:PAS/PAC sensor signal transduction histidine kinase [Russula earlei]|uniref:PAS/PAC sensor signal transduction histidine kinase n=1 Tax=Russula earlei TaxID=71964 RepID=A0ACC0TZ74_9AGAM|nr:PAS/PAC sensor signal transduction histidine kinase [Russula earlei]
MPSHITGTNTVSMTPDIDTQTLQSALVSAGLGIWKVMLKEPWTVIWDDRCKALFGIAKGNAIPYAQAIQAIHEDDRPQVDAAVKAAIDPAGIDDKQLRWVNFIGKAHFDDKGAPLHFTGIARDLTDDKRYQESELQSRSLIEQSPVRSLLLTGENMVITRANKQLLDSWGKDASVIGIENQIFPQLLAQVYTTGIPHTATDTPVTLTRDGQDHIHYFDFTYQPMRTASGSVYGILSTAIDVTEKVRYRQKIEEAELYTRSIFYNSPVAKMVFTGDDMAISTINENMFDILGRDASIIGKPFMEAMPELTATPLMSRLRHDWYGLTTAEVPSGEIVSMMEGDDMINRQTGQKRLVHSIGKPVLDQDGEVVRIDGVSRDVTAQRQLQGALEDEVQLRTEELAATNEELKATNDELYSLNEELEEANGLLTKSNEELAQYAYVASHDLQEPLRKIRIFSDMLDTVAVLPQEHKVWVEKINQSAERMTLLIKDLLTFSRLLKSDSLAQQVDLKEVINSVVSDFELTILEKNATIEIGDLPVVEAISLQMNQLFYNLISNALKFTNKGVDPHIKINAVEMPEEEIIQYIPRPVRYIKYYLISFIDNGIGFETQYIDQIFEIFKRLHSKEVYPGSGIGLALCRNIVANHNGHLYAVSEPGKGSTFAIILPAEQAQADLGISS